MNAGLCVKGDNNNRGGKKEKQVVQVRFLS